MYFRVWYNFQVIEDVKLQYKFINAVTDSLESLNVHFFYNPPDIIHINPTGYGTINHGSDIHKLHLLCPCSTPFHKQKANSEYHQIIYGGSKARNNTPGVGFISFNYDL